MTAEHYMIEKGYHPGDVIDLEDIEQYATLQVKQEKIKLLEKVVSDIKHACQGHSTKGEVWNKYKNQLKTLKNGYPR